MKKILLIAAAFIGSLSVMAQDKADDVIKVNTEKHDFGKIKQGVPVTTYFVVTNTSNKPIIIERAWGTCGCTTPDVPKEPIPAGGSTKLKVEYNAAALNHFEKDVFIQIAGVAQPKNIKITGEVLDATAFDALKKTGNKSTPAKKAVTTKSTKKSK